MNQFSYQKCYEILSLPSDVEWEEANKRYRRLVQQWHPDRYDGDDPKMAEQRFIELTTAFNALRDFHQAEGSLPFARATIQLGEASNESNFPPGKARVGGQRKSTGSATRSGAGIHGNKSDKRQPRVGIPPKLTFALVAGAAAVLLLVAFSSLESKSRQKYQQEAESIRIEESLEKSRQAAPDPEK